MKIADIRLRHVSGVLAVALAFVITTVVLVKNAWSGDDMWITLRAVDNLVHGFGPTWNTHERVQVFTHPLWMLVLSLFYFVTREGYYTTLVVSFACDLALVAVAWRGSRDAPGRVLALVLLLVSSQAFVDYSGGGLEGPLTHLLATAFFFSLRASFPDGPDGKGGAAPSRRRLTVLVLLVALAYTNRADSVLGLAPAMIWATWRARKLGLRSLVRAWVSGLAPALAWTAFAVVYFGFPVPNTAFSKLAGGYYHAPLVSRNAVAYFQTSWGWDPISLLIVPAALIAAAYRRSARLLCHVVGALLLLAYASRIGGDYMAGRLFALPYLLGALVVVDSLPSLIALPIAAAAAGLALFSPHSPVLSSLEGGEDRSPIDFSVMDVHRFHRDSSLLAVLGRGRPYVEHARMNGRDPLLEGQAWPAGAMGIYGFVSGTGTRLVDYHGLTDPLLSRVVPVSAAVGWGRGHFFHPLPEGYIASVETGSNRIVDPSLHAFYDKLLVVTTGPLFTWERARTIWGMNTGEYGHYLDEYEQRHPTRQ